MQVHVAGAGSAGIDGLVGQRTFIALPHQPVAVYF